VIFVVAGIVNGLAWLIIGGAVLIFISVGMILLTRWMARAK
jgi:ATP-dependent Lon protease